MAPAFGCISPLGPPRTAILLQHGVCCGRCDHCHSYGISLFRSHSCIVFQPPSWRVTFLPSPLLSPLPSSIITHCMSSSSSSSLTIRDETPVLTLINDRMHLTPFLFLRSSFSGHIHIWTCSQESQWKSYISLGNMSVLLPPTRADRLF